MIFRILKKSPVKFFLSLVVLFSLTLNLNSYAWTVNPVRFEVKAEKGKEYTLSFTVLNESQLAQRRLKIFTDDWGLDKRNGFIIKSLSMGSYENPHSAVDWIKVTPTQFVLPPGASRKVRFTLTIPPTLPAEGDYTAGIFVQEENIEKPPKGLRTVFIKQSSIIAVVVYVTVGKESLTVSLDNLATESGAVQEKGFSQVTVLPSFNNTGNTHTRGKISLMLTPVDSEANSKLKDKIEPIDKEVLVEDVVVLRESMVEYPIILPQYLPIGSEWSVEMRSDFGKSIPILVGKKKFTVPDPNPVPSPTPTTQPKSAPAKK